ncbi:MAG: hypothetical protein ACOYL5_18065 [Phototrophicaceae bacterium]
MTEPALTVQSSLERWLSRRWSLPLGFLLLALILLHPAVFGGRGVGLDSNDLTGNFYPLFGYTTARISEGAFPLWNPHQFIGLPAAANPQAAVFYPPTWGVWGLAALGMTIPHALGWSLIFHLAFGAWGMAVWVQRNGSSALGGLAAGIVFAFSGWMGVRLYAGHYTLITVAAWIPLLAAAFQHALHTGRPRDLIAPAAALGMAALGGHPHMLWFAALVLVALAVYAGINPFPPTGEREQKNPAPLQRAIGVLWRLCVVAVGGVLLGAALLIPTAELTAYSPRADADLTFLNKFALPPAQLLTMALPFLYGNPKVPPSYYWGADFVEETSAYAGLIPLLALLLALRLRRMRVGLWVGLAVAGVLLSLGIEGVLWTLGLRWIPLFGLFRAPGRYLFFTVIGLAGVTALWITTLQASSAHQRRELLAPALKVLPTIVGALLAGSVLFSGWFASASHVEPMPHRAALVAGVLGYGALGCLLLWGVLQPLGRGEHIASGVWLMLLALLLWDGARAFLPIVTASDVSVHPLWDGAQLELPPDPMQRIKPYPNPNAYFPDAVNNASLTRHYSVDGYDPLAIDTYTRLQALFDANDPNSRFHQLMGVGAVVSHAPREDTGWELVGVQAGSVAYARTDAPLRAWVATRAELIPDDDAAQARLLDPNFDITTDVILSTPLDCPLGDVGAQAVITDYQPESVTLTVESAGGVLILNDQFYSGWRAWVNDVPAPIVRANTVFRAICVPAGAVTVRFAFQPVSVAIGAAISTLAWLIVTGLGVTGRRQIV